MSDVSAAVARLEARIGNARRHHPRAVHTQLPIEDVLTVLAIARQRAVFEESHMVTMFEKRHIGNCA